MKPPYPRQPKPAHPTKQFEGLEASQLYCPTCRRAMPVRKKLLLVLPEGEKFEYLCARCATTCGDKIEKGPPPTILIR
jgi:hypothetical protein